MDAVQRAKRLHRQRTLRPRRGDDAACLEKSFVRPLQIEKLEDRRVLAPLVGIDFDPVADNAPPRFESVASITSGQMIENIGGTNVDVTFTISGDASAETREGPIDPAMLPSDESSDLHKLDGFALIEDASAPALSILFSDLAKVNLKAPIFYEIYVFGLSADTAFGEPIVEGQQVTITGASVASFQQSSLGEGELWVNGKPGATTSLDPTFKIEAVPTSQGTIDVQIASGAGVIGVAGVAIRGYFKVDIADDSVDPDDDKTTLREAMLAVTPDVVQKIVFAAEMAGETIMLDGPLPDISFPLTIDGGNPSARPIIDAQNNSRVFNVTESAGNVSLREMLFLNGFVQGEHPTPGNQPFSGGLLRSVSTGTVTLENIVQQNGAVEGLELNGGCSYIAGDAVVRSSAFLGCQVIGGFSGSGGALFVGGDAEITDTTFENNSVEGGNGSGGGANVEGFTTLTDVWFKNNTASGFNGNGAGGKLNGVTANNVLFRNNESSQASGGALFNTGPLELFGGTIDNNRAGLSGGGFFSTFGDSFDDAVRIENSTISRNQSDGDGGGFASIFSAVTVINSTISGNESGGPGAGINAGADVTILNGTVTGNTAGGDGGGVRMQYNNDIATFVNAILAGNTAGGEGPDFKRQAVGGVTADYSLIGDAEGIEFFGQNNLIGDSTVGGAIDPMLGPLTDNGGPSETHEPLPGSPVIDAGDPAAVAGQDGVPLWDQRGLPYRRVEDYPMPVGGGLDIGAVEKQPDPSADFDGDGAITGSDFLRGQQNFGLSTGATRADGDADNDGDVDQIDQLFWESEFGKFAPDAQPAAQPLLRADAPEALSPSAPRTSTPTPAEWLDMALAATSFGAERWVANDDEPLESLAVTNTRLSTEAVFLTLAGPSVPAEHAATVDSEVDDPRVVAQEASVDVELAILDRAFDSPT